MKNFILKDENAVYHECGYSCDNAIFLSLAGRKFFLTDARYSIEARELCKDTEVIEVERNWIKDARLFLRKMGVCELVYNPYDFSAGEWEALGKGLGIRFKARANFSQISRIIKSEDEIKILKQAAQLGAQRFDEFAAFVRANGEGMSEEELFFNAELIFKKKRRARA